MDAKADLIPEQEQGGHTGASARVELASRHDAIILFTEAKQRLRDVNRWNLICGKGSADFRLADGEGNILDNKLAEKGMYIRIELPAPPNKQGAGYDWVRIEEFESAKNVLKDEESFGFRVRPAKSPVSDTEVTAHFFTRDATSTFLVIRETNTVKAVERGRNEIVNAWPRSWLNKVRNFVVGTGAMIGLSVPQWKSLVNGLLKGEED